LQEYLHASRLKGLVDGLGLHLIILIASILWFILLWGLGLPALSAGCALYGLMTLCIRQMRARQLKRRERQLRIRIGGEMALERLLTAPPARAHFELTLLLSLRYPMMLLQSGESGVLCSRKGERLLIAFQQLPGSSQVTAEHVLPLQRQAAALKAQKAVLCAPCPLHSSAREQAASPLPVTLLSREQLITLLGEANPATDDQLAALGQRKRDRAPASKWLRIILDPQRAPRCLAYGALLLVMYAVTGMMIYLPPGLLLVGIAAAGRIRKKERKELI